MKRNDWGLRGIFSNYFPQDFFKDMAIPVLAGIIFAIIQNRHQDSLYANLIKLIDYVIVYLPVMATIILTAYTMMIGAMKNAFDINNIIEMKECQNNKDNPERASIESKKAELKKLQASISASFASNIVISILALALSFVIYLMKGLELHSHHADLVNSICFGVLVASIIYPIVALIGIVSDMFSISRI